MNEDEKDETYAPQRHDDLALNCVETGWSNPIPLTKALHEHLLALSRDRKPLPGGYAKDPAVVMFMSQLCTIFGFRSDPLDEDAWSQAYVSLRNLRERQKDQPKEGPP